MDDQNQNNTGPVQTVTPQSSSPINDVQNPLAAAGVSYTPNSGSFAAPVSQPATLSNLETPETTALNQPAQSLSQQPTTPLPSIPSRRTIMQKVALLLTIGVGLLFVIALAFVLISRNRQAAQQRANETIPEQAVTLPATTDSNILGLEVEGQTSKLIVNGALVANGDVILAVDEGNVFGQISASDLTTNQSYSLPDDSGTFCLDSNNCGFLQTADLPDFTTTTLGGVSGAITLGTGLTINGTTLVNSFTETSINNLAGDITLQGTSNQIIIAEAGDTITLTTPQDIATTSSPTFNTVTLSNVGTQNGNVLCDISNNCGFAGGTDSYVQGGNSFAENAVLGTNDNFALAFETNNTVRLTLDTSGNATLTSGQLRVANGSAAAPSFTFTNDPDTGIYSAGANQLGVALAGGNVATFSATGLDVAGRMALGDSANLSQATGFLINETFSNSDSNCVLGCYGSQIIVSIDNPSFAGGITALGLRADTAATAFVQSSASGLFVGNPVVGAGSSINTTYGIRIASQTAGATDIGIQIDPADTQTLWLSGDTGTAAAGIGFGASRDTNLYRSGADTLRTDDTLSVGVALSTGTTISAGTALSSGTTLSVGTTATIGSLGATNTATHLCRNAANQIAGCSSTGAGAVFIQGGNTFGATATLGTNDSNSIVLETNNVTQATLAVGGAFTLQNSTDSTSGFRVMDVDGGNPVLNVDTTNERVGIGTATPGYELDVTGDVNISSQLQIGGFTGNINQCQNILGLSACEAALDVGQTTATTSTAAYGMYNSLVANPAGASNATMQAVYNQMVLIGSNNQTGTLIVNNNNFVKGTTGSVTSAVGVNSTVGSFATGTITTAIALQAGIDATTGTITTAYGLNVNTATAAGTLTNNYGINVGLQTAGGSDYGIAIQGADTQALWLAAGIANPTTANQGIGFGTSRDTNLYRLAADTLRTDDTLSVGTALAVGGATASDKLTVHDGDIRLQRSDTNNAQISTYWGGSTSYGLHIASNISATSSYANGYGVRLGTAFASDQTSGLYSQVLIRDNFNPTSGTATAAALGFEQIINQTGGANGITRGIYLNPTLTSAADYRGFEVTNTTGHGIYQSGAGAQNYFAGNVKIASSGTAGTVEEFRVNSPTTVDNSATAIIGTGATTNKGLVIQAVASQSANIQEWQSSTGTVLASISASGDLEVESATINGDLVVTGAATFNDTLTVNGHIVSGNTAGSTTVTAEAAAGVGASASISGNDTSGVITINVGTGATAGTQATITFANAYASAPNIVITPKAIPGGGNYPAYHFDSTTTTFELDMMSPLTDSTTYTFSYFVIE